ncbi:TonB-dependent receptor [Hyphococcus sp.]|uniref:TonB-dependent receptor n=1 Tax=Hyphococcus sp. TaxID=2038636 RepID=UPI003CCBF7AF
MKNGYAVRASAIAIAAAMTLPGAAAAQGIADQIVVTATKRAENIQDVPIAISAYSGDLLEKSGVSDIRELSIVSPSLVVVATQSEAVGVNARIRGVGTVGDNPGLQSSVGVFIDEVYRSRNSVALSDLGEIEAIEVARGPQGTLFGRNSSAGAIIVRTKQPEYEFGGYGEYTRSNFDGNRFEGALTGPLVQDVLAARINGFYENRDGFLTEVVTGDDYNDRDQFGLRGQLLFEPNDALSVRLIGDYSERDEVCCAAVNIVNGPTGAIIDALSGGDLALRPSDPFERVTGVTDGRSYTQDIEEWGASLQATLDLGGASLVSVTSYRDFEVARSQDIDYTRADIAYRPENGFVNGYKTFTQELRLNGQAGALDWLIGGYFSDEEVTLRDQLSYGVHYEFFADQLVNGALAAAMDPAAGTFSYAALTGMMPGTVFAGAAEDDAFVSDSQSFAAFTNNTFDVTDRLAITLGARYTHEKNDFNAVLTSSNNGCAATVGVFGATAAMMPPNALAVDIVTGPAAQTTAVLACLLNVTPFADTTIDDTRKENEFTWDAKLSYALSDNVSFYGGAARGYKAGGYNFDRAGGPLIVGGLLTGMPTSITGPSLEFDEETVINYEAGFKSTLLNGDATFNVTGFYAEYDDYQLNTFNGISFVVQNIAKVKSSGFEADFLAQATEQIFLQGGVTYANTRYGDNVSAPIIAAGGTPITSSDGRLLDGRQITLAPKWSATAAMTFQEQLWDTNWDIFMNWNARYSSEYNTGSDLDPQKTQDAFIIANASIGIVTQETGFELEAFVRNLTDADIYQVAFDAPLQSGSYDAFLTQPRTYGITARFRF